jgi:ubiquinone biosynthesis protein UbiJ
MTAPVNPDSILAAAMNGWLGLDPAAQARLSTLEGRVIALHLRILETTVTLRVDNGRMAAVDEPGLQPDTVLHGTPLGMLQLGLGGDTANTLFSGEVEITGDVETGQAFKAVLDDMDIDWEEQLSRLTGDVVAHQLGNLARRAGDWLRHGRETLQHDVGEYLQEEARVLPSRIEIENFISDVSDLAMAVERLEARLQRLQRGGSDRP